MRTRSTYISLTIASLALSACAPAAAPPTASPTATQPPAPSETPTATPTVGPPTSTPLPFPELPSDAVSYEDWVSLFDYDPNAAFTIAEVGSEQRDDVLVRDITFDSPYRGQVAAYLVMPPGEGPHPAVLYVHWYETSASDSNRTEFLEEAVSLARQGVVSLLVNDVLALPAPRRNWTGSNAEADRRLVIQQVVELRRALDVLIAEGDADPERIGYVGHDFGGMFGAVLAGVDRRVKTFVLMAMTDDFAEWFLLGSTLDRAARDAYREAMRPVAPIAYLPYAAPASVFLQFAQDDNFVSPEVAAGIFAAASQPKRMEVYPSDHALHHNGTANQDRVEWLIEQLGVAP